MNATELVAAAASIPGGRAIPVQPPLERAVLMAGVEIAATAPVSERTLRRMWRERRGGGATPLLLVADVPDRSGSVYALGVLDGTGPLRVIEADALSGVLARVADRPRLDAVRELGAELDRLDQAGVPGLKLRDFLTLHTLDVRLRRESARWDRAQEQVKGIPRGAGWREVLQGLGYDLERKRHRGFLARHDGRPIAVVHPLADPSQFARLDPEGRPPEGVLLNDCRADGAPFGLLTSGTRLRLFEVDPSIGSSAARWLDLDTAALQIDDLPFLALLGPEYLAEGKLKELEAEARRFGVKLRKRLDDTLRQTVLPVLGLSLGRHAAGRGRDLTDEEVRIDLERAALTLVFRALFLLYAESAGYLPLGNRPYEQASLTSLVQEAAETIDRLSARSTTLWDRFSILVKTMRTGNTAWGVPAYNGALFAANGFDGAETLERSELTDPDFGRVLVAIGRDAETGGGVDYSTLEIGHLGHIYEGLLSLHLSVADAALRYDPEGDRYVPALPGDRADVEAGDLLWQTHEGGRKGGGVYYTRSELVRHLVREAVVPAFEAHLAAVRIEAGTDPANAAKRLFDFAVLDPACGSAHFLVTVVHDLADLVVRFLAATPLPDVASVLERLRAGAIAGIGIDDVILLRRLVLKRCVFGVDVSPMGAEVAKLSLWLASFVPGLSLAYLGRNVVVGNSLVGVARKEALAPTGGEGQASWLDDRLAEAMTKAAEAAARAAAIEDRTPEEVLASESADSEIKAATAGLERVFDLWTAEPFGVAGAREEVRLHGPSIIDGEHSDLTEPAETERRRHRFLHWPLVFPLVFARQPAGFDAVVGNPPWEEVTVESLAFYALFRPGIRSLPEAARARAIEDLLVQRPGLAARLDAEQARIAQERRYFADAEFAPMPGDPDLYKFFCQRYRALLRENGALGVVLPRSTFIAEGSAGFRRWLFEENTCRRIDFLLNRRLWMFDTHPQYTIALVEAEQASPDPSHRVRVAGTAASLDDWHRQSASPGLELAPEAFGPAWTLPLLRSQEEADLLAKLRRGSRFPLGSAGRWRCFPVAELHETNDRRLWEGAADGWALWKGGSFDQYDPHGAGARWCPDNAEVRRKTEKPRPGLGSLLAAEVPLEDRRRAVVEEIGNARVAFRDVTRATDSRSVRACLVPPHVFLTNKAPYLAFTTGGNGARAACLGLMNSLPFDWQARRFLEINLNFFLLEGLAVPDLSDDDALAVANAAARLSCVDERFADFAMSMGIDSGELPEEERQRLRIEIDARVARAWGVTAEELEVLLHDFTFDAVPAAYRRLLRDRLRELS